MDDHFDALIRQCLCQCQHVILMGMHTARGQQTHHVNTLHGSGQFDQCRIRRDLAAFNGVVDAGQILHHHTAGTNVHVADLRVAHLPVRQPDGQSRGFHQRLRTGF